MRGLSICSGVGMLDLAAERANTKGERFRMKTIRALDLYCGDGGAAKGYFDAFTEAGYAVEITGVDIKAMKRYPYHFVQGDAMTFPLEGYDFYHASPPCQDHSVANNSPDGPRLHGTGWMLAATYERFSHLSVPWIIENVATAKMRHPVMLCGSMFGLNVVRHRLFDSNFLLYPPCRCRHSGYEVAVCGNGTPSWYREKHHRNVSVSEWKEAMGIDWMARKGLSQAIPPKYTEWLGRQIIAAIEYQQTA